MFVAIPSSATSESACDALRRWAHAYEGTSPTLDEVARFDRAHRVAIFNAISPTVRASLWQEQLRRFNHQSDLTDAQRTLIAEGIALTTPALYQGDSLRQAGVKAVLGARRIVICRRLLPPRLMRPRRRRPWSRYQRFSRLAAGPSHQSVRANAQYGFCSCLTGFGWCASGKTCVGGGCSATGEAADRWVVIPAMVCVCS